MKSSIPITYLLNSPVSSLKFEEQMFLIMRWARARESRSVFLANVHMLMEAYWNKDFAAVLKSGDLVSSDGMPLVWMLRKLGIYNQDRIAGMDVFLRLCELAQQSQVKVFFLGSQKKILEKIKQKLEREFPVLQIAGMEDLPFRPLSKQEDEALVEKVNQSQAGLIFVCLGCPKQEIWISQHQNKIQAVMIGVGAVFPVYADIYKRAPSYIRDSGLEWLYRFFQEPRRLWRRYRKTIPPFVYLAIKQLLTQIKSNCPTNIKKQYNRELNIQNFKIHSSKIGQILIRQNLLTEQSLVIALQEQKKLNDCKLGEILVQKGYISLPELKYHLKNQKIKLGEILLDKKIISSNKLEQLLYLQLQDNTNKKLGEIMLESNLISVEQLQLLLIEQDLRKNGWWLNIKQNYSLIAV
ncbi:putative UDP-N-acetyl-D-mannosaminuronic acid transferase [Stanieria sp. NIES-3757]|nr:putative UDP-N-acetyl-D-mannosaminuronic acid transferase [Stanieria sp. NIES-3757]